MQLTRTLLFIVAVFQDSKYTAVSGFLFLRFYAPAILGPKLFGLRNNHADKNVSRTLTILAKVGIIWLQAVRKILRKQG